MFKVNDNVYVNANKVDAVYYDGNSYFLETEESKFTLTEEEFKSVVRRL